MDSETYNPNEIAQVLESVADDLLEAGISDEATLRHYEQATELADEMRRVEGDLTVTDGWENPEYLDEGDMVRDTEPADWMRRANKNRFVVREVTDVPIRDYWFEENRTVAEANRSYDPEQPTVVIERDGTELAYPIERVERIE